MKFIFNKKIIIFNIYYINKKNFKDKKLIFIKVNMSIILNKTLIIYKLMNKLNFYLIL